MLHAEKRVDGERSRLEILRSKLCMYLIECKLKNNYKLSFRMIFCQRVSLATLRCIMKVPDCKFSYILRFINIDMVIYTLDIHM